VDARRPFGRECETIPLVDDQSDVTKVETGVEQFRKPLEGLAKALTGLQREDELAGCVRPGGRAPGALKFEILPHSPRQQGCRRPQELEVLLREPAVRLLGNGEHSVVLAIDQQWSCPGSLIASFGQRAGRREVDLSRDVLGFRQ